MNKTWPRGSEWRKWDLHIHAPGTKLNDQFTVSEGSEILDEYCKKLCESDVHAFGITDYFSADCFFRVHAKYFELYPDSAKVFFPNIELRTNDVVNKAQEEVNVHIVFNPFQSDLKKKIDTFLNSLKTSKTENSGRNICASELKAKKEFEEATTTRAFIQTSLEDTYGKAANLLEYVLIATAANNDGIRPMPGKHRKLLLTDELDKFSDMFFGNAGNVEYFLNDKRAEDKSVRTPPKPVISGSDVHSLSDMEKKLGKVVTEASQGKIHEPTWIKADLTFEGLKQIIFEPRNRVFIGDEPIIERRVRENRTHYIESLQISNVDGYNQTQHGSWFAEEKILLGKELVAIIGNRGSGKSAVTDIIGLLGNSHNQFSSSQNGVKAEELFSFLNKNKFLKSGCAKNFKGQLNWYDGEPDVKILDEKNSIHFPEKVEYLPQKYLERICANIADDEFRKTLNEVIFRYVKPQDRHGKINIEELIYYRTRQAQEDIIQKKQDLHKSNSIVVAIEKKLTDDYYEEIENKIKLKKEELEAHDKTKPEKKPNPESEAKTSGEQSSKVEDLTQKIGKLSEQILEVSTERVGVKDSLEDLNQVKQSIQRAADSFLRLEEEHAKILCDERLEFSKIANLNLDFTSLNTVVAKKEERLKAVEVLLYTAEEIAMICAEDSLSEDEQNAMTAASLVCQKNGLENQKSEIVDLLGKTEREYHKYVREMKLWGERNKELLGEGINPGNDTLRGLERELQNIKSIYPSNLRDARVARDLLSKDVFRLKRDLTQFYADIKKSIDVEITKCREYIGDYDISIDVGLRFDSSFFEEFLNYINQRLVGSFRGQEEGRVMLHRFIDNVDDWEDESQIFTALNNILDALHNDMREEFSSQPQSRDVFKQVKGKKTPQELYDYLFGFDYLEPKYDLRVDSKDVSELSPGERGGLLLIFYLMLDRRNIPLVIDQPEDNLDNKSVYEILVTFIKQAKMRRQIILVTHNPNLAVVADAEQIIHVMIDKKDGKNDFDFFSGSIEEPRINQVLVDILEGTLPAFDNRKLKYRKP